MPHPVRLPSGPAKRDGAPPDPLFVAHGHWDDNGTPVNPDDDIWITGDYHLASGSPCSNRGNDDTPTLPTHDFEGEPRIQQCRVDLGGDESPYYFDCNTNGVSDACDIAAGTSQDCHGNGNGIPDECEPDCNSNGVADSCDIADGTSPDVNGNGIPDDCEAACRGDCNCDGEISWRDIEYFRAALDAQQDWLDLFLPGSPTCIFANCDLNGDGNVNWRDVDPLVGVMNTTCPS
ncbi:MAG: hypothetical protein KAY37_02635 [Phycisphaerae bacterium]|nr:hypothetical protein [Phycisphaerae bacterium]